MCDQWFFLLQPVKTTASTVFNPRQQLGGGQSAATTSLGTEVASRPSSSVLPSGCGLETTLKDRATFLDAEQQQTASPLSILMCEASLNADISPWIRISSRADISLAIAGTGHHCCSCWLFWFRHPHNSQHQ